MAIYKFFWDDFCAWYLEAVKPAYGAGIDKTTYNHFDSYPDCLGNDVVEFCKKTSIAEMNAIFDRIILVEEDSRPTKQQIDDCIEFYDGNVSTQSIDDWYCLLRNLQGNFKEYQKCIDEGSKVYMTDGIDFIQDSLFCEYAYIINLDDEVLEFYEGFQKEPQVDNRYGITDDRGYYPCKLALIIPLDELEDVDKIVKMMECGSEEVAETMELNSEFDLTIEEAKEVDGRKIIAIWDCIEDATESEARAYGIVTDDNERYFNFALYGQDLLESGEYMELESGRVIYYQV
jgi:hypothetical protein